MIDQLKRAVDLAAQQSPQEQAVLAALLIEAMQANATWDALFADPRSDALLEGLVAQAIAEDNAGETEEVTDPGFLS
ncbi:MAG TPA: hypothetical protein VMV29_03850 [Ktedonobacterales bacterium]|nr:hypothetical protein [Ktedonobacterales bacterium]